MRSASHLFEWRDVVAQDGQPRQRLRGGVGLGGRGKGEVSISPFSFISFKSK